jgi:hypothetical protein
VDLPGYGYARGGAGSASEFADLTRAYFGRVSLVGQVGALLLVDARHPGLESDRQAWAWLQETGAYTAVVATKIDKLARGERIRAMRELESVFEGPVLPTSAVTGEGLDELWKLIDRLVNSRNNPPTPRNPPKATAPPPQTGAPRRPNESPAVRRKAPRARNEAPAARNEAPAARKKAPAARKR